MIKFILFCILVIIFGTFVGIAIRRDTQKSKCPYCSCRECCNIGFGIESVVSDDEQKPFLCIEK